MKILYKITLILWVLFVIILGFQGIYHIIYKNSFEKIVEHYDWLYDKTTNQKTGT